MIVGTPGPMEASPGDIVKVHVVAVMVAPLPLHSVPEKVPLLTTA
jgi:hypothetical protein